MPHKMPFPTGETFDEIQNAGIKIDFSAKFLYVNYELPWQWSYVDESRNSRRPSWYFLDGSGQKRFHIFGIWEPLRDRLLTIIQVTREEIMNDLVYQQDDNLVVIDKQNDEKDDDSNCLSLE